MQRKHQKKGDKKAKILTAVMLALDGLNWMDIAREMEITRTTLFELRTDPMFQEEFTKRQEMIFAQFAKKHVDGLTKSVRALTEITENKNDKYTPETQLKAAVELGNLIHRNVECIKVVEQNRKVLDAYDKA